MKKLHNESKLACTLRRALPQFGNLMLPARLNAVRTGVRPVMLLIKGTKFYSYYQSKPAHWERSKMRRRINKRSSR